METTQTKTKNISKSDGLNSPTQEETTIFTVKAIARKLETLAKFQAFLRTQFKPLTASQILCNPTTKEYFAYINFSDADLADKLQEVSP